MRKKEPVVTEHTEGHRQQDPERELEPSEGRRRDPVCGMTVGPNTPHRIAGADREHLSFGLLLSPIIAAAAMSFSSASASVVGNALRLGGADV